MDQILSPGVIWFLIGLALLLLEFIIPGVIIIFFGIGAWVTALMVWIFGSMSLNNELFIFIIVSVLLLILLRRYFKEKIFGVAGEDDDDNFEDFSGAIATVTEAIPASGFGKIDYKGAKWTAWADGVLESGTLVKIIDKNGIKLKVEKA